MIPTPISIAEVIDGRCNNGSCVNGRCITDIDRCNNETETLLQLVVHILVCIMCNNPPKLVPSKKEGSERSTHNFLEIVLYTKFKLDLFQGSL